MSSNESFRGISHLEGEVAFSIGQASQAGIKPVNEDCIGIRIPQGSLLAMKGVVAVIADGVSAAEAGREASEICVKNFLCDYFATPDTWSVEKSVAQVLTALNRWLYWQGQRFLDVHKGYVSTFSGIVFKSRIAHIFHVGDSRIYRLRGSEFEQLTCDHATKISEEKSYLARAMGLDVKLDVDYRKVDLEVGDLFLLTTDGVHDFIMQTEIKNILKRFGDDFDKACLAMLNAALNNNSNDNISCQMLRVDKLPLENAADVYCKLNALPFPPDLSKGMVLDGYRVERILHASKRSQLYLVSDIETNERLVMKAPSANFEDDPAYIERLIMEGWIGRRINNPHVVKVVEPNQKPGYLYYLTEFVDGLTLTQWMREHPRAQVEEVLYLLAQMVKGLRALHRRETLHQDVKPDNILIDSNGLVKLIDFGSCHVAGIAEISVPLQRDTALGTKSYSAPEYSLQARVSSASDQFSLAVIVYEMLTAKYPYANKLAACKKANDFKRLKYEPAYHYNPLVPIWMDGALSKALSIMPEDRYADVSEFLYDLQHPNPMFLNRKALPLRPHDSLSFWKALCVFLILLELMTLVLFLK
jgi:serine/threonine protein phosphatase PrpC